MQKINISSGKICTSFLLVVLIFFLSISAREGYCGELQDNNVLDEKVKAFLESRRGKWHDWNVPYSDGKILYDLILNP